jgi:hypothetical protein
MGYVGGGQKRKVRKLKIKSDGETGKRLVPARRVRKKRIKPTPNTLPGVPEAVVESAAPPPPPPGAPNPADDPATRGDIQTLFNV